MKGGGGGGVGVGCNERRRKRESQFKGRETEIVVSLDKLTVQNNTMICRPGVTGIQVPHQSSYVCVYVKVSWDALPSC